MKPASLNDRFRYWFDNYMAKGTAALIASLGVISLFVIFLAAALASIAGIGPGDNTEIGFLEAAWLSLMRTLDAGTMGGDEGWRFRLLMFVVTLAGVFIISTLIGVLTSGIEGKLDELRKGHSKIIESGHTIILGWSPQVFSILSELILANANQPKACIVVLGDKDKVEMEDEVHANVENNVGHTRIVCRTGNPIDSVDLERVSIHTARSIILLPSDASDPDAATIKTLLAITNSPNRHSEPYHIVAAIQDARNLEVAKMVGKDEVELILMKDLVSRIIAQTCRQSGLSVAYTELLDFGGDEIYFKEEPGLVGKSFGESLLAYEDSAVIGLCSEDGVTSLNPPMNTMIKPGDRVIVISEDDDTIRLSTTVKPEIHEALLLSKGAEKALPEKTLVLGWNQQAPLIIQELDNYVADGSSVMVVADETEMETVFWHKVPALKNQHIHFQSGDTTDRRILDGIDIVSFDHIILLCYGDRLDIQQADSLTLITLLHLRDIAQKSGKRIPIVSEMLDIRNRALAEITRADDFIVSNRIISLMMSQISENKALNAVFADIFDPEGSEIYLKPASQYIKTGVSVNFYTVVEAARRKGQVAMGYRQKEFSGDPTRSYGVVINPDKSAQLTFNDGDGIIVLAED